jgi:hypothetical protein
MKNIHILPTDNARLYIHQGKLYDNKKTMHIPDGTQIPHHIYITEDSEIKEGDWCYYENGDLKGIHKVVNGQRPKTMILKKIILTTDQDLIKDGVQAISDEFIELFVKNLNCERVEVKQVKTFNGFLDPEYGSPKYKFNYHIIIPQEELKQETLEEAAEKQWGKLAIINDSAAVIAFKAGAKWQAEKMYSEEDMREAFIAGTQFEEDYDYNLYMEKWFEQFKKK